MFFNKIHFLALLALLCSVVACVDQDFDEPPGAVEVDLPSNLISIAELKAKHVEGQFERLEEDAAIRAVVIADDESGNYFKTLILQDESGGIELKINSTALYNEFPIGREIYVLVKGLYLGDFAGNTQLGGVLFNDDGEQRLGGIEDIFVDDFIIKGESDKPITPNIITIDALNESHIHTLVELKDVQLFIQDVDIPYADAVNRFSTNLRVEECDGDLITLRSSGFADFADDAPPAGNGSLIGVYSVFNSTKQIFIRNTDDVLMTGERCDVDDFEEQEDTERITIEDLRRDFRWGTTVGPDSTRIEGVVISDRASENITNRNMVIQDEDYGVVVRFEESHDFDLGDKVAVVISGASIDEFNGLLQVNVENSRVRELSDFDIVTPRTVTIAEILDDFEDFESTLVKIENATISSSDGTSYSGSTTVTDATGSMVMFTTSYSSFASNLFPTNEVTITAIVGQGTEDQIAQLSIRNLDDIEGGEVEVPEDDPFNVTFTGQLSFEVANVDGWQNISMKGADTNTWIARDFGGNSFIEARGFNNDNDEIEAWFISPELDFDTLSNISFETAIAFWTHEGLSVLLATDYDGSNIAGATWTELDGTTLADASNEDYIWVPSSVSLAAYAGKGHIAFRHTGDNSTNTGTSRIDNIVIE